MQEIWKDIIGFEKLYQVSNLGRIKGLRLLKSNGRYLQERLLKPSDNGRGYLAISLYKYGKRKGKYVHKLVLEAFGVPDEFRKVVDHVDGNRANNIITNLRWATCSENLRYRVGHGTWGGEKVNFCKLMKEDVVFIRCSKRPTWQLAEMFNVTQGNINAILRGASWTGLIS